MQDQPNHTERRNGEKFLNNMTIHEFIECPWETKRRGNYALDEHGEVIQPTRDRPDRLFPIFVQEEE